MPPTNLSTCSDVYALGIILYEMLTDVLPYAIEGLPRETIVEQVRFAIPRPPSRIRPEIDDDLDTITLVALRKEPDRRYQSAAALMEELRRYLAGEVIEAKRDSPWYVLRKTLRYYRWQVVTGAVTLTVLVAFSRYGHGPVFLGQDGPRHPRSPRRDDPRRTGVRAQPAHGPATVDEHGGGTGGLVP